jgi:hypothetical protein
MCWSPDEKYLLFSLYGGSDIYCMELGKQANRMSKEKEILMK